MEQARIPGAALGMVVDGREEHAAFGVSSLASLRPVTAETRFQIASITKTYTATVIWRLIDSGVLAPDAPVRRYLPNLRLADEATAAAVTIGNLLEHTAGWFSDQVFDDGDDDGVLARYVEHRLPDLPQLFGCGEFFSYSNSAFQLLGRVIEVVTGDTYRSAVARSILDPLGAGQTTADRSTVLAGHYADGHTAMAVNGAEAVLVQTPVWLPRCIDPAGGLWSTTRDVLRYAQIHLDPEPCDNTAALLSARAVQAMQEPAVDVAGLGLHMGRSWFVQDIDGVRVISHNGDTSGQHAVLVLVPQRRFGFVVLLNGQPGATVALAALDAALCSVPGLESLAGRVGVMRALLAPADPRPIAVPAERLPDYAGSYVDPGQTTTLRIAGNTLEKTVELTPAPGAWRPAFATPPAPPAPVSFLAPDLAIAAGIRIPFVRNSAA